MLPLFPDSKKIELSDFHDIEILNNKFPPFNDFEFVSLWTYDEKKLNSISILNDNLVIKIQDFLTGNLFYSFLGCNNLINTVSTLIKKSKDEGLGNKLFLVPEVNFSKEGFLENQFLVQDDPNSFDYILSVDEIASLEGKKYYDKRNLINRFNRLYPNHNVKTLDINDEDVQKEIENLFYVWEEQKGRDRKETITELTAIKKLFELTNVLNIFSFGVYVDNKLVGFSTYHALQEKYALITFEKGDSSFEGIYAYLNHLTAKHLKDLGCEYINFEQDLGIPGLKKAKQLWRPVYYLKKYTITEL